MKYLYLVTVSNLVLTSHYNATLSYGGYIEGLSKSNILLYTILLTIKFTNPFVKICFLTTSLHI